MVFMRSMPLPCISWLAIECRSIRIPNFCRFRWLFSFIKNWLTLYQMSWLLMALCYSMLGELLIITLTFFRAGKMNFSESLMPPAFGPTTVAGQNLSKLMRYLVP